MDTQELLAKVKSQMELSAETAAAGDRIAPGILEVLHREGVEFSEHAAIGFVSHLYNLAARLLKDEHLAPMDPEVMEQIESGPLRISRLAAEVPEREFSTALDEAELILITIHVQTALAMMQKKKKGE